MVFTAFALSGIWVVDILPKICYNELRGSVTLTAPDKLNREYKMVSGEIEFCPKPKSGEIVHCGNEKCKAFCQELLRLGNRMAATPTQDVEELVSAQAQDVLKNISENCPKA